MISNNLRFAFYFIVFGSLCVVQTLNAQGLSASGASGQPDINHYGQLPAYRSLAISPDGKHYALIQSHGNKEFFVILNAQTLEIVGSLNAEKYKARSIQFVSNEHVVLESSKHMRMIQVRGSWESSSAFVYNLTTKEIKVLLSGSKGLYPAQTSLGRILGFNKDTSELYMPAFAGRLGNKPKYHLYRVSLKNGIGRIHAEGKTSTLDWFVDQTGKVLAREDYNTTTQKHQIYSKVTGKWRVIYSHETSIPEFSLQALSSDGNRLLFLSKEGNNEAVFSMSLDDGDVQGPLYVRKDRDVDSLQTDINQTLIAVKYSGFTPDYEFNNVEDNDSYSMLADKFLSSSVSFHGRTADNKKWLISVSGNEGAGAYKMFDRTQTKLYSLASEYPAIKSIGELKAVNLNARDGIIIPSIITLPTDPSKRKNLPLIAMPHGGPETYDSLRFNWLAQYLAAKGYAVLQPNFRGSTGFGYALLNSGYGEWGQKMQDDVSDGVTALANAGYIDPKRVCIMGGSYGGYSALAGGAFTPELYRCVISIAGVSDLPQMLSLQKFKYGRNHWVVGYWGNIIGDSKSQREKLRAISPINFAERFQAPVLLIHGKDDTVIPIRQSKAMYKALKKADKPVEFVTLKGEDHWLSGSETRLALLKEVDKFLDKHNPVNIF